MEATTVAARGGYELVRVPGGTFRMGSPEEEAGRTPEEGPVRTVHVPDFHLGVRPVTNEEYARFLDDVPDAARPAFWGEAGLDDPRQPVVGVRWSDAQRYCAWAGLRLPSEAEWEYACRAGTATPFATGGEDPEDLDRLGWYSGNSGQRLQPVCAKEPNAFGLFDMHGNVWEWCEDDWQPEPGGTADARPRVLNPRSPSHVIRGGAFQSALRYCRSAARCGRHGDRVGMIGFRPARG